MTETASPPLNPILARWRWFAAAGALVLLYALAGFFLVPKLARDAINDFVTQKLGKQVAIARLEFNPFLLAARVTGFKLTEPDGKPLIAFDSLFVNVQVSSLWHGGVTFDEITLAGPSIDAVIDGAGKLDLASLAPPSTEPAPEPNPDAALPSIRIGLLQVSAGRIALEDRTRATPFRAAVTPIQFTLNDFRTTANYQNAYEFAGTTQAGEQLKWAGAFSVQPLGSEGTFSIGGLKASTLWAYIQDQVAFTLPSGLIDLGGSYRLAVNERNEVDLGIELPEVKLSNVSVGLKGAEGDPWISLPELAVRNTSFSLLDRRVKIEEVAVNNALIDAWREADGSINLAKLAGSAASPPATQDTAAAATPPAENTTPSWQVELAKVALTGMTVNAADRSIEPAVAIALSPLSLTLENVSSDLRQTIDVNADLGINEAGRLKVTGKVRPQSLLADLDVELTDFGLPVLQPYLSQTTAMTVESGTFGIKGHVNYTAEPVAPQPALTFKGSVDVAGFASKDTVLKEDFIKLGLLSLTGIDYAFKPDRLNIDRILAREPYTRVIISQDSKLNVTQVLNPGAGDEPEPAAADESAKTEAAPKAPATSSPPPMPMRINTVVVENGSANFADYSVNPSFATGMQSLAGTIRGLSSNPQSRAKVDIKGNVDRFSPVVIAGEVNLLSASLYTDIALSFSNMELTTFNPYSGKFAGYSIAKGKLSTELKYKVADRQLEAEHHVVLDQLEFGSATDSKDAVPLPIKLAVALLKDRNGVIDINLPVRGSIDDPSFKIGPIVWKAVMGLMTRIVTAPFALLGSLFGGSEEMAFVDFAPGVATLTPEATQKLGNLAKALIERPQLKLDIPLSVRTPVDADALLQAAFAQTVPDTAAGPDEAATLQLRLQALKDATARLAGTTPAPPPKANAKAPPPDLDALRAEISTLEAAIKEKLAPTAAQLDALARSRAEAVQGALLGSGEIAPERLFLTTREAGEQKDSSVVKMELKLE
ncbi:MAG: DUF748 domain-containing protein [Steroidobacteraceae bacterium]